MNMRLFISYCHDVTLSAGCSIDDRDSGVLWPMKSLSVTIHNTRNEM